MLENEDPCKTNLLHEQGPHVHPKITLVGEKTRNDPKS